MWGRKEDPPAAPPASGQSRAEETPPRPAARPAAAPASPSGASALNRTQAQIGKSLKLKGEISGSEDLYIDGEVDGTVELKENSLTVGPNGNVHADVQARSITVLGALRGNVRAGERIEIRKTGSLEGDLVTNRIVIEDGAVFRGSIDIVKLDHAEVAVKKSPAATASHSAPPHPAAKKPEEKSDTPSQPGGAASRAAESGD